MLASVQFLQHAVGGAEQDDYIGSLQFNHMGGGMLLLSTTSLVDILSHFWFYRNAKKMGKEPVLFALALHGVTDIYWFWSGGSNDFRSQNVVTGAMNGYLTEIIAPEKRQKLANGPVMAVLASCVDVNWVPVRRATQFLRLNAITDGTVVLSIVMKAYEFMFG